MSIAPKQIGWSGRANLLWAISKQLDRINSVLCTGPCPTTTTTTTIVPTTTTTTTICVDFINSIVISNGSYTAANGTYTRDNSSGAFTLTDGGGAIFFGGDAWYIFNTAIGNVARNTSTLGTGIWEPWAPGNSSGITAEYSSYICPTTTTSTTLPATTSTTSSSSSSSSSTTTTTTTLDIPNVVIGTQRWSTINLDVSTYRDGTPIPEVTDPTAWANLTTGAWCYYNNDPANGAIYGKLYNWYAVNNIINGGLAPVGQHIPTDAEWTTLTNFLGGYGGAGSKMKETGTTHWASPNTDATNESGFTALGGGYRSSIGSSVAMGIYNYLWSSSEFDTANAWYRSLNPSNGIVDASNINKKNGFSVRCIID